MAKLISLPTGLEVALAPKEEIFGLKKSFTIPWKEIVNIAEVTDLWVHIRGIRAPGTGFPGVIMLGTTRYQGKKDFNAVYGHKPGFVISLTGGLYARVLATNTQNQPKPQAPTSHSN